MQAFWWILAALTALSLAGGIVGIFRPEKVNLKTRREAFNGAIVSAIVLAFSVWMLDPFDEAGAAAAAAAAKKAEALKDPATYAIYLLGEGGPVKAAKAERRFGDGLFISYSFDPIWKSSHARDSFLARTRTVVPALFDQFSNLRLIDLRGSATLVSIRGHESVGEVAHIRFNRDNASTINWKNVLDENLPKLANYSWFHPDLSRP